MWTIKCVSCGRVIASVSPSLTRETLIAVAKGSPYAAFLNMLHECTLRAFVQGLPLVCVACFLIVEVSNDSEEAHAESHGQGNIFGNTETEGRNGNGAR